MRFSCANLALCEDANGSLTKNFAAAVAGVKELPTRLKQSTDDFVPER
jgi:hypothetical protein